MSRRLSLRAIHPTVKAILSQLGGTLFAIFLAQLHLFSPTLNGFGFLQASGAVIISMLLQSPRWWVGIHCCFVPALILAQKFSLPPFFYLFCFVLLILVYWTAFRTRVPLYLTNTATADTLSDIVSLYTKIAFLDLGAGTGSLLRQLAHKHPDIHFSGIENAPLPWLIGWLLSRKHTNVFWRHGNFFTHSWEPYQVVYAFLSPAPMAQVWNKALREMSPDTLLISNSFPVPDLSPELIYEIPDQRQTRLYLYRIPAKPELNG